jgi:hypothetical protein
MRGGVTWLIVFKPSQHWSPMFVLAYGVSYDRSLRMINPPAAKFALLSLYLLPKMLTAALPTVENHSFEAAIVAEG